MTFGRMIFRAGELAVQLMGTNIRRILVADAAGIERFVGNRDCVFARLSSRSRTVKVYSRARGFDWKPTNWTMMLSFTGTLELSPSLQLLSHCDGDCLQLLTKKGRAGDEPARPFSTRG